MILRDDYRARARFRALRRKHRPNAERAYRVAAQMRAEVEINALPRPIFGQSMKDPRHLRSAEVLTGEHQMMREVIIGR